MNPNPFTVASTEVRINNRLNRYQKKHDFPRRLKKNPRPRQEVRSQGILFYGILAYFISEIIDFARATTLLNP
jgi:hypothetical protein